MVAIAYQHVIHDGIPQLAALFDPSKGRGLIPRDYARDPVGSFKGIPPMRAVNMPLIPRDEWSQRARDLDAASASLKHVRDRAANGTQMPSLNQGSVGYCWAHSTAQGVMLARAVANEPYVALSAYSVAATIKRGADQGGWGAASAEFMAERGIMPQSIWPQGDRDYKKYDKPDNWAEAAKFKITEGWVDIEAAAYDRTLSFEQQITLLLSLTPVVGDHNWWGHSIIHIRAVEGAQQRKTFRGPDGKKPSTKEFDLIWGMNNPVTAGWGSEILNSWGDGWGDKGTQVLTGSKAPIDGGVGVRVVTPMAA